jgi:hypothetical protein
VAQTILLLLPALCVALFAFVPPLVALRNYLLLLPFLPEFLIVRAGVAFTGSRIASLVLLLVLGVRATGHLLPRLDRLDLAVLAFLGIYAGAVLPDPLEDGAIFMAGFACDILLPYYFLRCLVRTTEDVCYVVRSLLMPTIVVAAMAAHQSITGFGPFDVLKFGSEDLLGNYDAGMKRLGLTRADAGLTHYIMMGLYFASHLPLAIGHYVGLGRDFGRTLARVLHYPLGSFFSLSGGSFLVTGIGLGLFAVRPLRRLWPGLILAGVLVLGYVQVSSNRGVFAILARLAATDVESAWYRLELPAEVFARMPGHWLTGFGRAKPDMGQFNDITNHYLFWLLQGGLPCMLAFLGLFVVSFQRLYMTARLAVSDYLRWLSWGLAACLLGLMLGMVTVTLFGQMRTYLFLFLALAACAVGAAQRERAALALLAERLGPQPSDEPSRPAVEPAGAPG